MNILVTQEGQPVFWDGKGNFSLEKNDAKNNKRIIAITPVNSIGSTHTATSTTATQNTIRQNIVSGLPVTTIS
jgi:hypothetical protein